MTFIELLPTMIKCAVLMGGVMGSAAYFVLLERRMAAWVQDRRGPNRVGVPLSLIGLKDLKLFGLGQPLADGLKMILKEEYTPGHVDKRLYTLAPLLIMSAAVAVFAVIPFGATIPPMPSLGLDQPTPLVVAPGFDIGMLYVFALSSIAVYGVILGGWASNNKYSFLGGLRSSAQLIAYELPLGLGILGVVLAAGSLDLTQIIHKQTTTAWFVMLQPLGFLVFVVAAFAESARLPFDLPECEQELIGGYHTEYAGMKLVLFLTAEFIHMITASFLIVILFCGAWHLPFGLTGPIDSLAVAGSGSSVLQTTEIGWGFSLLRVAVLMGKVVMVILFFMLVRWSWPRFRFDQLMSLAWKVMLPLGMVNLVAAAFVLEAGEGTFGSTLGSLSNTWVAMGFQWVVFIVSCAAVTWAGPLVADNRPRRDLLAEGIDPQV